MANRPEQLLRQIRRLAAGQAPEPDAGLLARFVRRGDEAAFAELVKRHGPMVLGVCRRVLRDEHQAEDAFQAAFLVLAKKAASIRPGASLAAWLHTVARHLALKCGRDEQCRRRHELGSIGAAPPQRGPLDELTARELLLIFDEELQRLPEAYRSPVILCALEGHTTEEAARLLGLSPGSLRGRLVRGRARLHARLTRRGVVLPAGAAVLLAPSAGKATVPAMLATAAVKAAALQGGGSPVFVGVSPRVAALARSGLTYLTLARMKVGLVLLLVAGTVAAGLGTWAYQVPAGGQAKARPAAEVKTEKREQTRADRYGDPLPPGALARLGTVRQRAPDSHLAVTADGKEVVAVSGDLTVRRFDARTGALRAVRRLARTSRSQYQTWLSPRGTFALDASVGESNDYHLDLWDLAKGKLRQKLPLPSEHQPVACGAAFSADERRVAVADSFLDRKTLRVLIWDLETSQSRVVWSEKKDKEVPLPYSPVVVPSPDGKRLVVYHLDQTFRCWEVESGKLLWQAEEKKHCPLIVFSADSRIVYTRSEVEKPPGVTTTGIDIRDAATGKLLDRKKPPKEAFVPIGSSPDGRFVAFQTMTEEVVLWEPGKEKVAFRFPRPPERRDDPFLFGHTPNRLPTNFAFTPDGKGFIRRAGSLQRWDLTTGKPAYTDTENWGHTEDVTRLLFSPDGRLLASSSKDRTVRLWDVSTARTVHAFSKEDCDHLAFTPDGRFLLTVPYIVFRGSILQARDVTGGRRGRGFGLADQPNTTTPGIRGRELRLTADGRKILMLNWQGDKNVLMVWNAATGACLVNRDLPLRGESLLTPDGQSVLAFDHAAQSVLLLSLETMQPRWQLKMEPVQNTWHYYDCDLALSSDGRLMAARLGNPNVAGIPKKQEPILLADMATGRQLAKLSTDGPAVFAFSSGSRLLAIAGPDGIRLWETATGKEAGFIQHRACAGSLAFAPDGRTLATGHADGAILLWDATLGGGVRGGPLTAAQREALWADLAGADAAAAYAAVGRLADDPGSSISFLKERLRPVPPAPPKEVRSLLDDLDSDRFAVREAAERKLRELGGEAIWRERVIAALRAALQEKPSLEKRRRVDRLLAALESRPLPAERLRAIRAMQLLERIGSAEARKFLEELSRGAESARLTRDAKEALTRLKKRG